MTANWFDGRSLYPPVKPGTVDERHRARRSAAQLVVRNQGTADDLAFILAALGLFPAQDTRP